MRTEYDDYRDAQEARRDLFIDGEITEQQAQRRFLFYHEEKIYCAL